MDSQIRINRLKYLSTRYTANPDTGCWEWKLAKDEDGYGYCSPIKELKINKAHRVSYLVHNNIDLNDVQGLHVCHTCDNPGCINPEHLFLGTAYENNQDRKRKGHYPEGHLHQNSKLSDKDVLQIRNLYSQGSVSKSELGRKYGVSDRVIYLVVNYEAYKNVKGE